MYKLLADQLQSPSALWVEPNTELRASRFFNQTSWISCSNPHLPMWMWITEVRFVDLTHWLRIKHRLLQLQKETKSLKRSTTKGSKPHYRQSTIMERSDSSPPHLLSPPYSAAAFNSAPRHTESRNITTQPATTSAHEKLKLLSHLAWLRENGDLPYVMEKLVLQTAVGHQSTVFNCWWSTASG